MGYNELEIELRKTLDQIDRWRKMGCMPTIEQGIALGRLQEIYAGLLDLPCSEPQAGREDMRDSVQPHASDGYGDGIAPDDESFEPCCDPTASAAVSASRTKADDDGNFADLSVEERKRTSDEAHLSQEVGEQDPCPSQSRLLDEREAAEPENAPEADKKPVETPVEKSNPETPAIFGIGVSPYARQEIIDTLFHGNLELFNAECGKLNVMDSLEEALVYIGETYRWIPENAATIKFIDLLETRFRE